MTLPAKILYLTAQIYKSITIQKNKEHPLHKTKATQKKRQPSEDLRSRNILLANFQDQTWLMTHTVWSLNRVENNIGCKTAPILYMPSQRVSGLDSF